MSSATVGRQEPERTGPLSGYLIAGTQTRTVQRALGALRELGAEIVLLRDGSEDGAVASQQSTTTLSIDDQMMARRAHLVWQALGQHVDLVVIAGGSALDLNRTALSPRPGLPRTVVIDDRSPHRPEGVEPDATELDAVSGLWEYLGTHSEPAVPRIDLARRLTGMVGSISALARLLGDDDVTLGTLDVTRFMMSPLFAAESLEMPWAGHHLTAKWARPVAGWTVRDGRVYIEVTSDEIAARFQTAVRAASGDEDDEAQEIWKASWFGLGREVERRRPAVEATIRSLGRFELSDLGRSLDARVTPFLTHEEALASEQARQNGYVRAGRVQLPAFGDDLEIGARHLGASPRLAALSEALKNLRS